MASRMTDDATKEIMHTTDAIKYSILNPWAKPNLWKIPLGFLHFSRSNVSGPGTFSFDR
jgi:hypothetical protein